MALCRNQNLSSGTRFTVLFGSSKVPGPRIARTSTYALLMVFVILLIRIARWIAQTRIAQTTLFELGFDSATALTYHRRPVRTRKGYLALGPGAARPGDHLTLVKGNGYPLVLRASGKHWELIGDAYTPGIMNGEVFEEKKCTAMWIA
jgi:hypothetical protein